MAQQSPLSYSVTQANSLSNPLYARQRFPDAGHTSTRNLRRRSELHIGYLHYWQASVQQNLASSIVLTLTYQGDVGTHQLQEFLPNTFRQDQRRVLILPVTCISLRTETPTTRQPAVQLQRRFRSGFLLERALRFLQSYRRCAGHWWPRQPRHRLCSELARSFGRALAL